MVEAPTIHEQYGPIYQITLVKGLIAIITVRAKERTSLIIVMGSALGPDELPIVIVWCEKMASCGTK